MTEVSRGERMFDAKHVAQTFQNDEQWDPECPVRPEGTLVPVSMAPWSIPYCTGGVDLAC